MTAAAMHIHAVTRVVGAAPHSSGRGAVVVRPGASSAGTPTLTPLRRGGGGGARGFAAASHCRRRRRLHSGNLAACATASNDDDDDASSTRPERSAGPEVDLGAVFGRFTEVATPFWVDQSSAKNARWLLAGVVGLTLGTTAISVGFNFLGRDFYNSIAEKKPEDFDRLLKARPLRVRPGKRRAHQPTRDSRRKTFWSACVNSPRSVFSLSHDTAVAEFENSPIAASLVSYQLSH